MRVAVVNIATSIVENVAEIEDGDTSAPGEGYEFVPSDTANIGDTKAADGSFTAPVVEEALAAAPMGTSMGVQLTSPTVDQQDASREAAYRAEADWLFFKAQRGEIDISVWQKKVDEIKARFPYPAS